MMSTIISDAAQRAERYLSQVHARRISPTAAALQALNTLDIPLQDGPLPAQQVLAELDEYGSPATLFTTSPRFFGFVIGGSLPAALGANILAAAWDQNASLRLTSPVASLLEETANRWLVDVLGLPTGTAASFVTGATMANFTCLAAARHAVLAQAGWDVEARGLFNAPPVRVLVGDEVHVTVLKALGMLGLGRENVERLPVDGQGRVQAGSLPKIHSPSIVCLQAGNVNTGAIDPIDEICSRLAPGQAWVHVDGAFGLWASASPALSDQLKGVEMADSWATDAHKWLNVPYDSGLAFIRQLEHLKASMSTSAAYLVTSAQRDPHEYTPEFSRRARGVEIWAALRSLGRQGLAEMVERCCSCARQFAQGLTNAGFSVLNEVNLNQVLVSFGSPQVTLKVIQMIQEQGTAWCGGTTWQGKTAMRISVSNYATSSQDVERCLEIFIRLAHQAQRELEP